MTKTEKLFLIICIFGAFGVLIYFYLFPAVSRSWAMTIASVPALLCMVAVLVTLPEAIRRVRRGFSYVRQGHLFLWFNLFIISLWIFRTRDAVQLARNPVDPAALVRILAVAVTGVIVFSTALTKRKDIIEQLSKGLPGLMFLYGLIGIVSVLYSPYRSLTLYKACEIIVDVSTVAFFLSLYPSPTSMKRWIDLNWFMIALLIACIWIGAMVSPRRAFRILSAYEGINKNALFPVSLQGIMPIMNPNEVGFMGAGLSIASLSRILHASKQKERTIYVVSLAIGLITLVAAQSRASLIGGFLAIILVLLLNKRIKFLVCAVLFFLLVLIYSGAPSLFMKYFMRGQHTKLFLTLTGRIAFWTLGWEVFKESPLYGYGFGAGTRYVVLYGVRDGMSTIHNAWLEILVNVGILGLIPVAFAFIGTWFTLLRISIRPPAWFSKTIRMLSIEMVGLYVLLNVRLITSASFLHDRDTLLFLLVVAYVQQIRNWERTGRGLSIHENSPDTQSIQVRCAER